MNLCFFQLHLTVVFWFQVVKGLGETLVGAYPGRSLSFICKKNNLDSPLVLKLTTGVL